MFRFPPVYHDRRDAGRRLADRLARYAGRGVSVLALPRGGVIVADEVADRLRAPLDVCVVRKIAAPDDPEYALGAVSAEGTLVLDTRRIHDLGLARRDLEPEIRAQTQEAESRGALYREGRPPAPVEGRTAIVVDDGIATGSTARAAVQALRMRRPRRVVLAAAVASTEARDSLSPEVDEFVCPCVPALFLSVGTWYRSFPPVTDNEVLEILERHAPRAVPLAAGA